MVRLGVTVGHVPKKILSVCSMFLRRGAKILRSLIFAVENSSAKTVNIVLLENLVPYGIFRSNLPLDTIVNCSVEMHAFLFN